MDLQLETPEQQLRDLKDYLKVFEHDYRNLKKQEFDFQSLKDSVKEKDHEIRMLIGIIRNLQKN